MGDVIGEERGLVIPGPSEITFGLTDPGTDGRRDYLTTGFSKRTGKKGKKGGAKRKPLQNRDQNLEKKHSRGKEENGTLNL